MEVVLGMIFLAEYLVVLLLIKEIGHATSMNPLTNLKHLWAGDGRYSIYIYIITPYILHDSCLDEDGDVVVYNDHGPFLSLYDNCTAD